MKRARLDGTVKDKDTGKALSGIQVKLGRSNFTMTNHKGAFRFSVSPGTYYMIITDPKGRYEDYVL